MHMVPANEQQRRHHELASGLRPGQEKRRKNIADQRAAKKESMAVDSKGGVSKTEPKLTAGEPMDVDPEGASVL